MTFNNYKIEIKLNKLEINNKKRNNFDIRLWSINKRTFYFIQCDSNIWWKPKRIIKNTTEENYKSIGWLFIQFGKYIKK